MSLPQRLIEEFQRRFGSAPHLLARAPGRVNLIGEHTDYNDGFVLPMAIDRAVWVAFRPTADRRVRVYSLDFDEAAWFSLDSLRHGGATWLEYLKGVAWALQGAGHRLAGWEGVVAGDVPLGAGLSSSAALELATARAFAATCALEWQPAAMAMLCQQAESQWVGMNCGIMDQLISAAGKPGHALLIDCRSLEIAPVPLPPGSAVVVMDTGTRRGLVDSAYNLRRAQCEAAAQFFGVPALRDVRPDQIAEAERNASLDGTALRRARHVVTENDRTLQAAEAMQRGDAVLMGSLMRASHLSLRDDFEVSSPALDALVACAQRAAGCFGARMTGAGFGGCAVALVSAGAAGQVAQDVGRCYEGCTGLMAEIAICQAAGGAELEAPRPV